MSRRHRHSLRHQATLIPWCLSRRGWHPRAKRLGRLRALYWTVIRLDGMELCNRCGAPVGVAWHTTDDLWIKCSGFDSHHGQLCPACFSDEVRRATGKGLFWSCSQDPNWGFE